MHQDEKELIEYQAVMEQMRHYSNMRFAYLTLFFGATAALGSLLLVGQPKNAPPEWLVLLMCFGGMFISFAFWVCEERTSQYWGIYKDRAVALEDKHSLGSQKKFKKNTINATLAVRCMYLGMTVAWGVILWNLI